MNNKRELETIDKQIKDIKENSEYKRLSVHRKGIKDDQRFKNFQLQLDTLSLKRDQLIGYAASRYSSNGRIIGNTTKPLIAGKRSAVVTDEEGDGEDDADGVADPDDDYMPPEQDIDVNSYSRRNKVQAVVKTHIALSKPKPAPGDKYGRVIGKRLKPKLPADKNAKVVTANNNEFEATEIDEELDNDF